MSTAPRRSTTSTSSRCGSARGSPIPRAAALYPSPRVRRWNSWAARSSARSRLSSRTSCSFASSRDSLILGHDLFRKPVPTFRDHALMQAPSFWWQEPGTAAAWLAPLATVYGAVAGTRLRQTGERADMPVLCVGNPTLGGSGKTPTALALARLLIDAGERPFLLSRGYGGRLSGPVRVDLQHHRAEDVGDEALLLARAAPTIIAHDRVAGARAAQRRGAGLIVLDDGFQNPSLAKDLSILVVDAHRGIGNGRVFPAGPLRAPLEAQLERAQAMLIIGDGPAAAEVASAAAARG